MGFCKLFGPRVPKVRSMPEIQVQIDSFLHFQPGYPGKVEQGTTLPAAIHQDASGHQSTLASTQSMHPLRMHPVDMDELFASRGRKSSSPQRVIVESQLEPDMKEATAEGLRPTTPASAPSAASGWTVLRNSVSWGGHFESIKVNRIVLVTSHTPVPVEITLSRPEDIPSLPPMPCCSPVSKFEEAEAGCYPMRRTPYDYPLFFEPLYTDEMRIANRYKGSRGTGLAPLTYDQVQQLKANLAATISQPKARFIPRSAYLRVPLPSGSNQIQDRRPPLPKTRDASPQRRMGAGQTAEVPTNALGFPIYRRYYTREPRRMIVLSGSNAEEIIPTNITPSPRNRTSAFNTLSSVPEAQAMASASPPGEPAARLARELPPCLAIKKPTAPRDLPGSLTIKIPDHRQVPSPPKGPTAATFPIHVHYPYRWPAAAIASPTRPELRRVTARLPPREAAATAAAADESAADKGWRLALLLQTAAAAKQRRAKALLATR